MTLEKSTPLWPLLAYAVAVVALVVSMIALSAILGEWYRGRATGDPYESGIVPTGSARIRLSAQFYLVAILFVVFDIEAVLIFAWAIAAREVGWPGYAAVAVFIGILAVALVYEWRLGVLDWGKSTRLANGQRGR